MEDEAVSSTVSLPSSQALTVPTTCLVCLRKLKKCELGKPKTCGHVFCFTCIHEWSKNVNTCPVDRVKFNIIQVLDNSGGCAREVAVPDHSLEQVLVDPYGLTYCEVCSECTREDRLLLCDGCDKGFHLECLDPPIEEVPEGNWYCVRCELIVRGNPDAKDLAESDDGSDSESEQGDVPAASEVDRAKQVDELSEDVAEKLFTSNMAGSSTDVDVELPGKLDSFKGKQDGKFSDGQVSPQQQCSTSPSCSQSTGLSSKSSSDNKLKSEESDLSNNQHISLNSGGFLVDKRKRRGEKSTGRARTVATGVDAFASIRQAVIASHKCTNTQAGLAAAQRIAQGVWQAHNQSSRKVKRAPGHHPMVKNVTIPTKRCSVKLNKLRLDPLLGFLGKPPRRSKSHLGTSGTFQSTDHSGPVGPSTTPDLLSSSLPCVLPSLSPPKRLCSQNLNFSRPSTTDYVTEIFQGLDNLQAKEHIFHRDGSIQAIRRKAKSPSTTSDYVTEILQGSDDLRAEEHIYHHDGSIHAIQRKAKSPSTTSDDSEIDIMQCFPPDILTQPATADIGEERRYVSSQELLVSVTTTDCSRPSESSQRFFSGKCSPMKQSPLVKSRKFSRSPSSHEHRSPEPSHGCRSLFVHRKSPLHFERRTSPPPVVYHPRSPPPLQQQRRSSRAESCPETYQRPTKHRHRRKKRVWPKRRGRKRRRGRNRHLMERPCTKVSRQIPLIRNTVRALELPFQDYKGSCDYSSHSFDSQLFEKPPLSSPTSTLEFTRDIHDLQITHDLLVSNQENSLKPVPLFSSDQENSPLKPVPLFSQDDELSQSQPLISRPRFFSLVDDRPKEQHRPRFLSDSHVDILRSSYENSSFFNSDLNEVDTPASPNCPVFQHSYSEPVYTEPCEESSYFPQYYQSSISSENSLDDNPSVTCLRSPHHSLQSPLSDFEPQPMQLQSLFPRSCYSPDQFMDSTDQAFYDQSEMDSNGQAFYDRLEMTPERSMHFEDQQSYSVDRPVSMSVSPERGGNSEEHESEDSYPVDCLLSSSVDHSTLDILHTSSSSLNQTPYHPLWQCRGDSPIRESHEMATTNGFDSRVTRHDIASQCRSESSYASNQSTIESMNLLMKQFDEQREFNQSSYNQTHVSFYGTLDQSTYSSREVKCTVAPTSVQQHRHSNSVNQDDTSALLDCQRATDYVRHLLEYHKQKGCVPTNHLARISEKAVQKVKKTKILVPRARVKKLVDDYIAIYTSSTCVK